MGTSGKKAQREVKAVNVNLNVCRFGFFLRLPVEQLGSSLMDRDFVAQLGFRRVACSVEERMVGSCPAVGD